MITFEQFKSFPHNEVFQSGFIFDNQYGCNIDNSNELIKYVAKKGGINDWALYVGPKDWSYGKVRDIGSKVTMKENILKCINVSEDVFKVYRH